MLTLEAPPVMGACSALSAALLEPPARARVLAALPRVLYLQVGPRHVDLLPIEASDGIGLPTAMRLPLPAGEIRWGLREGDEVAIRGGVVTLPGWTIRCGRRWRPAPVTGSALACATEHANQLWSVLPPGPPLTLGPGLLGAGEGLTPSGDDHLCGALLAWRAAGREAERAGLWAKLRTRLRGTTSLSASLLSAAAAGYAVPAVTAWIDAVAAGDLALARRHTPAVLALGHSSGQDLIRGALTAFTTPPRELGSADPAGAAVKEDR